MQVCKTRTCIRTCEGWPNGFASRLGSSRKSQKVVNSTHIQMTYNQLVSTCVGWPNDEKLAWICTRIELNQSQCKSSQVHARGWTNETQDKRNSKTGVDLRVRRLTRGGFGEFKKTFHRNLFVFLSIYLL